MQQKIILFLILTAAFAFSFSCSGRYVKNRMHDAADIFTAEVTTGSYGLAVQAGPVSLGAHYKSPGKACGLRGGFLGCYETASFTALFFGTDYFAAEPFDKVLKPSVETEDAAVTDKDDTESGQEMHNNAETDDKLQSLRLRNKELYAKSPFGTVAHLHKENPVIKKPVLDFDRRRKKRFAPAYHYTRLELIIGLYFGLRLGINIGELADFLAGITGLDLYRDDAPYEPESGLRPWSEHPLFEYLPPEMQEKILENE